MKTMFLGSYWEPQALAATGREQGITVYLHCLDRATYMIGDDADGRCFDDIKVSTEVGERLMRCDLCALEDLRAEIKSFLDHAYFKVATDCIISNTDSSILHLPSNPS